MWPFGPVYAFSHPHPSSPQLDPTPSGAHITAEAAKKPSAVITMGCGDECPYFPGKGYEDWVLDDPAGQGVDAVRPIRDDIRTRIEGLIASLTPAAK
jgi:arsenate reductase (thioredoxin)